MPNSLEGALNIVINSKKEGMEMCVPWPQKPWQWWVTLMSMEGQNRKPGCHLSWITKSQIAETSMLWDQR
jgi:hypothetical protein